MARKAWKNETRDEFKPDKANNTQNWDEIQYSAGEIWRRDRTAETEGMPADLYNSKKQHSAIDGIRV